MVIVIKAQNFEQCHVIAYNVQYVVICVTEAQLKNPSHSSKTVWPAEYCFAAWHSCLGRCIELCADKDVAWLWQVYLHLFEFRNNLRLNGLQVGANILGQRQ